MEKQRLEKRSQLTTKQVVPFVLRSLGKAACMRQGFANEKPKKTLGVSVHGKLNMN